MRIISLGTGQQEESIKKLADKDSFGKFDSLSMTSQFITTFE